MVELLAELLEELLELVVLVIVEEVLREEDVDWELLLGTLVTIVVKGAVVVVVVIRPFRA